MDLVGPDSLASRLPSKRFTGCVGLTWREADQPRGSGRNEGLDQ